MNNFKRIQKILFAVFCLGGSTHVGFSQDVITFDYTGTVQTYTVPAGITRIHIEAFGAQGGTALNDAADCIIGGLGGQAEGELDVTPGDVLNIYVGGKGEAGNIGGWNGGGEACDNESTCAKGGGASDIRIGGTELTDRVIVAGGGGGAEWSGCSGSAGNGGGLEGAGGAHPTEGGPNGGGGTQVAGGVAGVAGYNGEAGTFGIGGAAGAHPSGHSGSGGGGWYGGGGSAEDGHAGGGSSYIADVEFGATTAGVREGDGQIIITELCIPLTITMSSEEICFGDELTLEASGDGVITWSDGVINGEPFTPDMTGTLVFTVESDLEEECSHDIEVLVLELPEVVVETDLTEVCLGDEVILIADGADEFTWDPIGVESGVPYATVEVGVNSFEVVGLDVLTGCENSASVDVMVFDLPDVGIDASSDEICFGDEVTLSGTGALDYTWMPFIEDGVSFEPIETGEFDYSVTGVDENGCSNMASFTLVVHDLPTVSVEMHDEEICFGQLITLSGEGAVTYEWEPGDISNGEPFALETEGLNTFTVTGTDANGCENTATTEVFVQDELVITYSTIDEIMGSDGEIDVTVSGGSPDYTFDWDIDEAGDFDDTEDLTGLEGGTYTLMVMDDNGCLKEVEITVSSQLGVVDLSSHKFKVYPNPTTDNILINGTGEYGFMLKSVNGQVLIHAKGVDTEIIDLTAFARGIYYLTIEVDKELETIKIVKQ
ncbi:glycine-rich protein [Crocinitomix algicola]|uniref:glycine-rich protein n=1 Tax=Crocinitomix algicola TaxID=1740263 RepID=UPI00082F90AA|nr:glycine-rich protein [Crocinitomix algicola]